jgi:hypothetical protein
MDTADGEQRRGPLYTADVRRVGCKHVLDRNNWPLTIMLGR